MTAEEWATVGELYFNDEIGDLLGISWTDVDVIRTGSRDHGIAVRWRTEEETQTKPS